MEANNAAKDTSLSSSINELTLESSYHSIESIESKINKLSFEFQYNNYEKANSKDWVFSGISLYSCILLAGLGMQSFDNNGYNQIFKTLNSPGGRTKTTTDDTVFNNLKTSIQDDIRSKFQSMENRLTIPSSSSSSSRSRARSTETDPEKVQLVFSHSAWRRQGTASFKDSYIQLISNNFSNFHVSEFTKIEEINDFVKEKTRGKIPNLLETSDPSSFCLISAIYFKGKWANPFKVHMTKNVLFDKTAPCSLMEQTNNFNYYSTNKYQAIALPYKCRGTNLDLRAVIILRDNKIKDNEDETSVGTSNDNDNNDYMNVIWQELYSNLKDDVTTSKYGTIKFPRFKATKETNLVEFMKNQLNIIDIFTTPNCFHEMFDPYPSDGVLVDQVKQVAVIECDEHGTEAAAATVMSMRGACMPSTKSIEFEMICDHPFEFFIVDFGSDSGLQLFGGHITNKSIVLE